MPSEFATLAKSLGRQAVGPAPESDFAALAKTLGGKPESKFAALARGLGGVPEPDAPPLADAPSKKPLYDRALDFLVPDRETPIAYL